MKTTIEPLLSVPNLYVLYENGRSVVEIDAQKTGLPRDQKRHLLRHLTDICRAVETDGVQALKEFIAKEILRKLDKDEKAAKLGNLWEVRSHKHSGRIIFVFEDPDSIIVSAVNKGVSSKSDNPQTQAINRGVNRWQALLSNLKQKV